MPSDDPFFVGLVGWLLAGFLSGVHCLGMCGGLSTAISLQLGTGRARLLFIVHLGRIASYTAIGAALGGVASVIKIWPQTAWLQQGLYVLSLLMIALLGLHLAGWNRLLARVEQAGRPIWRMLQPHFQRALPLRNAQSALVAGLAWGWLPCGLVYSAAIGALSTGRAWQGAATLLAFGLGTLPNLLAMGLAAERLGHWLRRPALRQV
jgi:hypothetical protein